MFFGCDAGFEKRFLDVPLRTKKVVFFARRRFFFCVCFFHFGTLSSVIFFSHIFVKFIVVFFFSVPFLSIHPAVQRRFWTSHHDPAVPAVKISRDV